MQITEYTTALIVFTCNSMCNFMAYYTRKSGTHHGLNLPTKYSTSLLY